MVKLQLQLKIHASKDETSRVENDGGIWWRMNNGQGWRVTGKGCSETLNIGFLYRSKFILSVWGGGGALAVCGKLQH